MDIMIVATKDCHHRLLLERELQNLGVSYSVHMADDDPELVKKYGIHSSPNILIDDKLVFQATPGSEMPSNVELKSFLQLK